MTQKYDIKNAGLKPAFLKKAILKLRITSDSWCVDLPQEEANRTP